MAGRRTWVRKSAAAVITEVDPSMAEVLGWGPDEVIGTTSLEFIHPDDQTMAVDNWMQMLGSAGPALPLRFRHRHRDGSWRWVEMTNHNHLDDPARAYVLAEMLVAEEAVAERAPKPAEQGATTGEDRPLQLHEALPVGVLHVDANRRVLYTNRRLHDILSTERAATLSEQLSSVVDEDAAKVHEAFETALHGGLDNDIEVRVAVADPPGDKGIRQCTLSIRTLSDAAGQTLGAVACLVDVTESVRMRDELRLQATFDTLTTCYNRASTMEALSKMLGDVPAGGSPAVIFVDLDRFKNLNDHLGHAAGDQMLEILARRLQRAVREGDIVGRIGGDEFLVLCPGIRSPVEAVRAATRVTESLRQPLKLDAAEVSCRASVGVAWSADAGTAPDTLIGQADRAMYEAKRA